MNKENFSITLEPFQAFQVKRGYEEQGYIVNMMQVHREGLEGLYKYFFTMHKNSIEDDFSDSNMLPHIS